jgi:hypothetical protein
MRDGSTFFIDFEDFELVNQYYWHNSRGYARNNLRNTTMHRMVLGLTGDKDARYKLEVDHINKNRMDNRKCNLRIVSRQRNMYNKSEYKNNTSNITGVKWNKNLQKWQSQITFEKKRIHLGVFLDFDEAVKARKEAEMKYHR